MFPHPINAFGGLVAEITAVKVSAQKEVEANLLTVGAAELGHLDSLFLAALVRVGEVASGLGFEENREVSGLSGLWHDDGINRNIDLLDAPFELDWHVHAKAEGARLHGVELDAITAMDLLIAARFQPGLDCGELPLLLGVSDDRIGDGTAQAVGDDGRRAVDFDLGWGLCAPDPDKDVWIGHLLDNGADLDELGVGHDDGHAYRQLFVELHTLYKSG